MYERQKIFFNFKLEKKKSELGSIILILNIKIKIDITIGNKLRCPDALEQV